MGKAMLQPIKRAWALLPLLTQLGLVVLGLALAGWALTASVGWMRENWRAHRYEQLQREEAEKRAEAEAERDEWIRTAVGAEARAGAFEDQATTKKKEAA